MKIGVISFLNPIEFKDYLFPGQNIPDINNAASAVNAVVAGFLKDGHQITVITVTEECIPLMHLKGGNLNIYIVSAFSRIPKAWAFRRLYMVKRLKPLVDNYFQDVDVIHAHWAYEYPMAAASMADKKPVFCTVRDWAPIIRTYLKGNEKIVWRLFCEPMFKKVLKNKRIHFIANSPYIKYLIKSAYPFHNPDVIENSIKKEYILKERHEYPLQPVIVSITQGFTERRKNYTLLLRAFQQFRVNHSGARLVLIGAYNREDNVFKQWEKERLLDKVELKGFISHDDLIKQLDLASMLVHPSLEESFGNTLLEGMSRRIPVIGGSDSGAIPYVLGMGKYGILCDVKDINSLTSAMEVATDIHRMEPMINRATNYLTEELNNEKISLRHITLFSQYIR